MHTRSFTINLLLQVIDHYENPRNVGSLDKKDKNVGTGLVGAPACGDVMKLQIRVDDDGKIIDAKFKTFGCGSAIASSSLATEWVKGKTVDEALKLKNTDIAKELSLPPVKLHCSSKLIDNNLYLLHSLLTNSTRKITHLLIDMSFVLKLKIQRHVTSTNPHWAHMLESGPCHIMERSLVILQWEWECYRRDFALCVIVKLVFKIIFF